MKIIAINYADGIYKKQQKINSFTATAIGKADEVVSFSKQDIDPQFKTENKEIFSEQRGSGLWLWKPYFVLKTLEKMQSGEYLVYADSGILYMKSIRKLVEKLDNSGEFIMLFDQPLVECQWTNPYTFDYLECNTDHVKFSSQRLGGLFIIKKSDESVRFVREWLNLCRDKNLLTGAETSLSSCFIAHREDQSILSVLSKKHGIKSFENPTDYGVFPTQDMGRGRYFFLEKKTDNYKINNAFFLLYRKTNPIIYYIKYLVKKGLKHPGSINI